MPNPRQPASPRARPRVAGLRRRATENGRTGTGGRSAVEVEETPERVEPTGTAVEPESTGTAEAPESTEPTEQAEPAESAQEVVVENGVVGVAPVRSAEPDDVEPDDAASDDASEEVESADAQSADTRPTEEKAERAAQEPVTERVRHEPRTEAIPRPHEEGTNRGNRVLITALLVATAVFAVVALFFGLQVRSLQETGPAANDALTDGPATSEINGQVTDAVAKVFSYDFADTAKTERAANEVLTGQAVDEYNRLFATVKQQAPLQKLVVTTTVKASGVTRLQGDRAEVLLFVDQQAVRTDSGQTNVGPAQIVVGVEKHGDRWKINKITQR
ncbi:Mce-associated membrane protein [Saccharopolyspora erythraea NRRL 2338]|uniref:Uncharacterized protein n=2 Tax=Saccharopolyspora erythraea TaxID=1836 RepID=A4FPP5_SACEN|nr:hypothetical protein [Saccharopolyspora erythraea]PFG99665.1 Mce-associated membrane protein [Saccharopolyspora erythraea NRRL 2338]QRK89552.1 hypothetical protein JQX30_34315 [Saccharopolyspora erythraea]CAM06020.1 hypothetical protein SACE_6856 [Saccharopolyspora erythraea NRRL 2338]